MIAEELVKIDDERLAFVTITAIDVDNELNRAYVFFDHLEGEDSDATLLEVLEQHRRRIQSSINRQMRTKKTPVLVFKPDDVDPRRRAHRGHHPRPTRSRPPARPE